mmetsp:Transcript_57667/g.167031  ORF Transcript_57667/g.167031 Transcript_57667/m.167031 type:complete len:288 (-) Transcript_57667:106-969(-)|eukprot:CAMPEP_0170218134 /NCGR_PEP_ID=MMETSP0116_2-20130129/8737_1 /TAXON_ID=400756 /ORGANISM="Durinskia baltica, Strain CSIRO CS-38" /LENGTH=287 /DNA_ID=CAMNT_0010468777 /DNA_START=67 /DNA_END=930 /DNA_ORIENTATION=+
MDQLIVGSLVRLKSCLGIEENFRHLQSMFMVGGERNEWYEHDSLFHVVPGSAGGGSVSLVSFNYSDKVVRHCDSSVILADRDSAGPLIEDMSWFAKPALNGRAGCVSLESVSLPSHFVRHHDGLVRVARVTDTEAFRDGASWCVEVVQKPEFTMTWEKLPQSPGKAKVRTKLTVDEYYGLTTSGSAATAAPHINTAREWAAEGTAAVALDTMLALATGGNFLPRDIKTISETVREAGKHPSKVTKEYSLNPGEYLDLFQCILRVHAVGGALVEIHGSVKQVGEGELP